MKSNKKRFYLLCLYLYHVINITFIIYLAIYVLFLKDDSIYYTYLMILLSGVFLGYTLADKAYRYILNHNNKDIN